MHSMDSTHDPLLIADLAELAQAPVAGQPMWSCASTDLNANLIVLDGDDAIPAHTNAEVDGATHRLVAGRAILIPKGTNRAIRGGGHRLAYLTCHQRRAGLWPRGVERPDKG